MYIASAIPTEPLAVSVHSTLLFTDKSIVKILMTFYEFSSAAR